MTNCTHRNIQAWSYPDGPADFWSCADCSLKFVPITREIELELAAARADAEKATTALNELIQERDAVRAENKARYAVEQRDVWYWQGDGSDHPESLANTSHVVMTGQQARHIMADAARWRGMRKQFAPLGIDISGNHSWQWRGNPARLRGPTLDAAMDASGDVGRSIVMAKEPTDG